MRAAYIVVGTVLIVALLAAVSLAFVARGSAAPSTPRIDVPAEAVAGLVTIRFSSHERGVPTSRLRYRCSVDSSAVAPCRSPHAVRLAAGAHSFRVQAVDPRGRRSAFAHVSIHLQALAPSVKVGVAPVALTFGANALWTADYGAGTVTRIEGGRVKARINVGGSPGGIAVAGGSVWVGDFEPNGRLTRIDPSSNRVTDRIDLGGQPAGLLAAGNVLWVADYSGFVERIDATTGDVTARIRIDGEPEALALGFGLLWVTNQDGTLSAVDPATNSVSGPKVQGDRDMDAVAIAPDAVWSTSFYGNSLLKIDPDSRRVLQRIKLGSAGSGVLVVTGDIWVSLYDSATVVRIDPGSGRIVQRVRVGDKPRDIVSDGAGLWVVNQGSDTISRLQ